MRFCHFRHMPLFILCHLPHPVRVQMTVFLLLYPVSVRFPAQIGYRSHFFYSCTRFSSVFLLKSGTDHTFSTPVPGFRPFSCSNRVQITIFLLLYPVSVHFPAQIGYRSPFSFSCTRFPSVFLLRSGTDHTFSTPVPGFRLFSFSNRVQITLFLLLYPCSHLRIMHKPP